MKEKHKINQSALFNLTTKKKLADILGIPLPKLNALKNPIAQYREREKVVKNKVRIIHLPLKARMTAHKRIFSLLTRIVSPDYLHSGIEGRSFKTNASAHQYCDQLLKLDLKDFYPSTSLASVVKLFVETLNCVPDVADFLGKICCFKNQVPVGSPASQAVAFYAHRHLFEDLARIAKDHEIVFTCYVDDLTFSGKRIPKGFAHLIHRRIERSGLVWHRDCLFTENQAKEVTGVIITKDHELRIPQKKNQAIQHLLKELHAAPTLDEYERMLRQLKGLLGYKRYVDGDSKEIFPCKSPKRFLVTTTMEQAHGK